MELELLPPHERFTCPVCKKSFTHLDRCQDKDELGRFIRRCKHCKKAQITNKFYIPFTERRENQVGKWSLDSREKGLLFKQLTSQGLTSDQAWRRINYIQYTMRMNKKRSWGLKRIEENRKIKAVQDTIENKKKFLEGLK